MANTVICKKCPTCSQVFASDSSQIYCPKGCAKLLIVSSDPWTGAVLAQRYLIQECIGSGGWGSVYRAEQISLHRPVAVKILDHKLSSTRDALRRFEQEARSLSSLRDPSIVSIIDFGLEPQPFIVMDFVEGSSLSDIIATQGALCESRTIQLALQIARALLHAHRAKIIHRDIKPSNVIISHVDQQETAKVCDFGVARIIEEDTGSSRLTNTGETVGSPHYMSPEQALGSFADERSDIYSFGCLLHEMLTGSPPFSGNNHMAIMLQHLQKDPPRVANVSADFNLIIQQCLRKQAHERYSSFTEIIDDLESLSRGKHIKQSKPGRKRWPAVLVAATLFSLSIFFITSKHLNNNQTVDSAAGESSTLTRLFPNEASRKFISDYAKLGIEKDNGEALRLYRQGRYSESAQLLLGSVSLLKLELKRLSRLQRSATEADKGPIAEALHYVNLYMNQAISFAAQCFFKDKQYKMAIEQYEQCIPYYTQYYRNTGILPAPMKSTVREYFEALAQDGNKAALDQARSKYESMLSAPDTY